VNKKSRMIRTREFEKRGFNGQGGVSAVSEDVIDARATAVRSVIANVRIESRGSTSKGSIEKRAKTRSQMRPHGKGLSVGGGSTNTIKERIWNHVPVADKEVKRGKKRVKVSSEVIKKRTAFRVIGGHVNISDAEIMSSVPESRR
jgi:hypothetical protein